MTLPRTSARADVDLGNVALAVMASGAAMAVLWWAQEIFIPIVLGVLVSYALDPIVKRLVQMRVPRVIAAAVLVGLVACGIGYAMWTLSDDAAQIVTRLPVAAQKLRQTIGAGRGEQGAIEQVQKAATELQKTAEAAAGSSPVPSGVQRVQITEPAIDVRGYLFWGSAGALVFAGQLLLVLFFVFFLLASGDLFRRKLVKIAGPSLEKRKITMQMFEEITMQIERFLLMHLFASVVVGVVSWIAFRLLGLEQAGLWAILAAIFNSIPYFGPVIVAAGTAVVAFLQFGTLSMALTVSGISLAITSLEGWLLLPWLTSRTVRTNPVAVFVGLIFWSFIWGVWGTLLAVPMLVVVKAFCDRVEDLKPVGELLGD